MRIVPRFDTKGCLTHGSSNLLVRWCTNCRILVCAECVSAEHMDHKHQTLEEAWSAMSKALTSMLQSVNDGISKSNEIKQRATEWVAKIESSEKRLITSVRKLERDLVEKSHQHAERLVTDIQTQALLLKDPLTHELSASSAKLVLCSQLAIDIRHCVQVADFKALAELANRETEQSINPSNNESYLAKMFRAVQMSNFMKLQLCSTWPGRVDNDATGAFDFWFSLADDTSISLHLFVPHWYRHFVRDLHSIDSVDQLTKWRWIVVCSVAKILDVILSILCRIVCAGGDFSKIVVFLFIISYCSSLVLESVFYMKQ